MQCPQCQGENRDTAKFCEECGSKLVRACPGCGQEVGPRAKFCPECGTRLTDSALFPNPRQTEQRQARPSDPTASLGSPPAQRSAPEAERRQLTVLFCDLVDSTALAARLDPEDWREVVHAYQTTCADVVQRFDGHIAQYLGDGLLIYFGYPQAHEDDAQRAVRTGLGMVAAIGEPNTPLQQHTGVQLAIRVGIHTGLVVVGEIGGAGRQEQLALGDTPNIAARLQSLAGPNTVVLSADTRRLVEPYFTYAELGPQTLKGVATPLTVSQVLGESGVQSRLDAATQRGLIPLVGREQEVGLLLERWAQVKNGLGQVVLLSGEAGIGKSRLVHVLHERGDREGATHLTFRCSPYHTNSALYPMIELLERLLQFRRDETPQDQLAKLQRALGAHRLPMDEVVPLLAAMLSLPHPQGHAPLNLSPQRQRQKTHEALMTWLLAETERQPVLAVWEDLHWADPSTLELLSLVLEQTPAARLLTLLTCRPEFHPPWSSRSYIMPLTLSRLGHPQVEVMITRLTGGNALPAEVVQQIVAKTDGVPLFVEELTKAVLESALLQNTDGRDELTSPLPTLAIPATLQDSLMARLDRLVTAKGLAQFGATLGRQFTYELLQAVTQLDDVTLQRELARLVDAELLFQRGMPPRASYSFKHALIQEIAYQSLLKRTRQQYHQRIAQVLEEGFPEIAEAQPELVAQHYTAAGCTGQAVRSWQRAGEHASDHSAYLEAISHFTTGIELLKTLPATPERTQQALTLHIALGTALQNAKGHAAPEVEHVYSQARTLCQQVGETPQLVPVLFGLWRYYVTRSQLRTAHELAETLLRLTQQTHDPALTVIAHSALGTTCLWLGALSAARLHIEESLAHYTPEQRRAPVFRMGFDPGVAGRTYTAMLLWLRGYPEQALVRLREALVLAHQISHPYSLAFARFWAAWVSQMRRDVPAVHEHAEAAVALATEQGFPLWTATGTSLRGWALALQGQGEEGMAQVRQGVATWRATGAALFVPCFCTWLADVAAHLGHPEDGLQALAEASTLIEQHEERYWEAEVCRLRGVLLLRQTMPQPEEAEIWLQRALGVARRQEAKSLELRAAMSLACLWQQQGKRAEARELLAPIYGWFTEGFDTADLREARALLEALS
jgi:class 3 adenylate cyclase/predicted ATPase